ncbi:hypothetical protein Daus18300_007160 [Diaporthe australafricana]|uniref:Exonuclease domain-containing protein n=1 Tax=Diaporthe australafricana TaxID=127596 RepID=A0ABR3WQ08_9PEZI
MERPISAPPFSSSAASGKTDQPKLSASAPNFLPVEISDSGELVLDPGQTEDAYVKQLEKLKLSDETLQKAGYVMRPLTQDELDQKKKCARCHKLVFKKPFKRTFDGNPKSGSDIAEAPANAQPSSGAANNNASKAPHGGEPSNKPPANGPRQECKYHKGRFNGRIWSCCRTGAYNQPCKTSTEHKAATYEPGELERMYRYYSTPAMPPSSTARRAVAIDCEMGSGMKNDSLCIRVSVVDYFTAEVLVDKLVFPDEPLLNYNTRFSGVNHAQMDNARSTGDCFFGIAAAREAIWKFVGPDTIVVAHSGQNDLTSLRWLHANIVDTQLVESLPVMKLEREAREKEAKEKARKEGPKSQAGKGSKSKALTEAAQNPTDPQKLAEKPKKKPKGSGRFSLKSLTKERIGRDIQMGKAGHDSVVDAIATRDIAHWNAVNFGHGYYEIKISDS